MQILPRICHILSELSIPNAFPWLISILVRIATGGHTYIQEMARTPSLVETLMGLLEVPQVQPEEADLLAGAKRASVPGILQILGCMAQAGRPIIRLLVSQGETHWLDLDPLPKQSNTRCETPSIETL